MSATGDSGSRQWPEITTVQRVRRSRIHQEEGVLGDDAAALPDRQRAPSAITLARHSNGNLIDGNDETISTNGLAGKRQHMFQQGNATRQVVAGFEVAGERFRRQDSNQFGNIPRVGGLE